QDPLDVRDLAPATELLHFRRDEFQDLVDQTASIDFAFTPEIYQFSVEAVAGSTPAILFDDPPPIDPERHILPQQFMQFENDSLDHRRQSDCIVHARLGIANSEFE